MSTGLQHPSPWTSKKLSVHRGLGAHRDGPVAAPTALNHTEPCDAQYPLRDALGSSSASTLTCRRFTISRRERSPGQPLFNRCGYESQVLDNCLEVVKQVRTFIRLLNAPGVWRGPRLARRWEGVFSVGAATLPTKCQARVGRGCWSVPGSQEGRGCPCRKPPQRSPVSAESLVWGAQS